MECAIPARSLKPFAKLISCMTKLGEELTIEATRSKITLSTVDSGRTAFVKCFLHPGFFETFQATSELLKESELASFKCKINLKALSHIFKAKQLEKSVDKSSFSIAEIECRLVFQHICKYGITKTHKLIYEDCERPMNANYAKEAYANRIVLPPKFISDFLSSFSHGLQEITWMVDKKGLQIQSFSDNSVSNPPQRLETKFVFRAEEFDVFQVVEKVQLTFGFKEFKAILSIADNLAQSVSVYFNAAKGSPILFILSSPDMLDLDFVLATFNPKIYDDDDASEASQDSRKSNVSSQKGSQHHRAREEASPSPVPQRRRPQPPQDPNAMDTEPEDEEVDHMVVDPDAGRDSGRESRIHERERFVKSIVGEYDTPPRSAGVRSQHEHSTSRPQPPRHHHHHHHHHHQQQQQHDEDLEMEVELEMERERERERGAASSSAHQQHLHSGSATRRSPGEQPHPASAARPASQQELAHQRRILSNGMASSRASLKSQDDEGRPGASSHPQQQISPPSLVHLQQQQQQRLHSSPRLISGGERHEGSPPNNLQFPFHSPTTPPDQRQDPQQPGLLSSSRRERDREKPHLGSPSALSNGLPPVSQRRSPASMGINLNSGVFPLAANRSSATKEGSDSGTGRIFPTREEEEDDNDDFVEGTPPPSRKKFKSLF